MSKTEIENEYKYELFLIAFTLIACAVIILYNCFMRDSIVVTETVYVTSSQQAESEKLLSTAANERVQKLTFLSASGYTFDTDV